MKMKFFKPDFSRRPIAAENAAGPLLFRNVEKITNRGFKNGWD
jgi:hypothetical protein